MLTHPLRALQAALVCAPLAAAAADKPIQDNSFLIEEAYNQEAGVVQHIATFQRFRDSPERLFTFTQEWPVGGIRHQLSYTVPYARLADSPDGGGGNGIGDVALNYRYQWIGDGDARLAVAPRFSVLLATGNDAKGRGAGATGYQLQLPVSWVVADALVSHSNVGYTWTPRARDAEGHRADTSAWNLGQSLVWLAGPRLNFLLEYVYSRGREVSGPGTTVPVRSAYLSPGVRWSYDFASGLQVVPGIAFPIGVGPSRDEKSVFLYLSVEHPFL